MEKVWKIILSVALGLGLAVSGECKPYLPGSDKVGSNEFGYPNRFYQGNVASPQDLTGGKPVSAYNHATMYVDKKFVICSTKWTGDLGCDEMKINIRYIYRWVEIDWEKQTVELDEPEVRGEEREVLRVRRKVNGSRNNNDTIQYYGYLTESGYVRFIDVGSIEIV